jgi:homoserine kinase
MSGPPTGVRVRVGATSANLGPGFDSFGLALDLCDEVDVRVTRSPGVVVEVIGEGAGEVGDGEQHLVARAVRRAMTAAGMAQPAGLHLVCRNAVPHGRGLGSSAAAVVAGLAAGRALAGASLDDQTLLELATEFEGHPDNAAAALLGGLTIAWCTGPRGSGSDGSGSNGPGADGRPRAVRVEPHPQVVPVLLVPEERLATRQARAVLPVSVSHADAAANAARAALLVLALTRDPDLLLEATRDLLHQRQRAASMPTTLELVDRLRAGALAAVVSGAGPSVLVLTTSSAEASARARAAAGPSWRILAPGIARCGVRVGPIVPIIDRSSVNR